MGTFPLAWWWRPGAGRWRAALVRALFFCGFGGLGGAAVGALPAAGQTPPPPMVTPDGAGDTAVEGLGEAPEPKIDGAAGGEAEAVPGVEDEAPAADDGAAAAAGKGESDGILGTIERYLPVQVLSRGELHRWERYVRGFRRDHNFALSVGASAGTWRVKRFGSLAGESYSAGGLWSRFQYSFHLPIWGGFGYLLGSSVGYHYEAADRRRAFRPTPAMIYPGVLVGLVHNFSPAFRTMVAVDANLERYNGIAERDGVEEDPEIHVTMQALSGIVALDFFYDLTWAVRLEGQYRRIEYLRPGASEDFPVDAGILKTDRWLGLGLVFHLI